MNSPLILIKHAAPRKDRSRPARSWRLSREGRDACHVLGLRLAAYPIRHVVSSLEPKAVETAQLLAEEVAATSSAAPDLHEHRRESVPFYDSPEQFETRVGELFRCPDKLVFGEETAVAARERFAAAVEEVVGQWQHDGPIVIVAHGTVISLLVGHWCDRDPAELWSHLGLPSFAVVSKPDRRLLEFVGDISQRPIASHRVRRRERD